MDEVADSCVVLRSIPPEADVQDVNSCLQELRCHGKHCKYQDIEKYEVSEKDVRWIIKFKNSVGMRYLQL